MSDPAAATTGLRGRAIVSLIVTGSFAALLVTGVVLFIEPHGNFAYRSGWTLWGLGKDGWDDLHQMSGLLLLVSGLWHLVYNGRPLLRHLRTVGAAAARPSRELLIAAAIVLLLLVATAWRPAALSYLSELSETAKRAWIAPAERSDFTPGAGFGRGRGDGAVAGEEAWVGGW